MASEDEKKPKIHCSADSVAQSKSTNTDGTWWLDTAGTGSHHTRLTRSKTHSIPTQPVKLPTAVLPGIYKKYNILKHFNVRETFFFLKRHERCQKHGGKKRLLKKTPLTFLKEASD